MKFAFEITTKPVTQAAIINYGHPLAIYQCPDIAAFQESHPSTIIHPFSEVPPHILQWGHELQLLSGAFSASQPGGLALAFLLFHSSPQGSSRGHDPPSIAAVTRASSTAAFPPLVTPILTGLTALLLSLGEWGERGVLALSVALPPPISFTPHDLFSARVSLLPPRLSVIASFTSQVPFPRRFLRSSLAVAITPHLLGGFNMLLHLLRTIMMRLHLWHLRLRSLLRRCVLCLKRISLLLRRQTLPRLSWLQTTLLWRFHWPLLHLLLASLLLPRLLLLLSWSSLPLRFLFGPQSLSSFMSSRTPKLIWMCTT